MKQIILFFIFAQALCLNLALAQDQVAKLKIKSMTCTSCQRKIETALKSLDGFESVDFQLKQKTATVKYNTDKTSPEQLIETIAKAGFKAERLTKN